MSNDTVILRNDHAVSSSPQSLRSDVENDLQDICTRPYFRREWSAAELGFKVIRNSRHLVRTRVSKGALESERHRSNQNDIDRPLPWSGRRGADLFPGVLVSLIIAVATTFLSEHYGGQ